ncbi:MAG: flagellar hook-length control protein FliK [Paracoccaceae bacterium]
MNLLFQSLSIETEGHARAAAQVTTDDAAGEDIAGADFLEVLHFDGTTNETENVVVDTLALSASESPTVNKGGSLSIGDRASPNPVPLKVAREITIEAAETGAGMNAGRTIIDSVDHASRSSKQLQEKAVPIVSAHEPSQRSATTFKETKQAPEAIQRGPNSLGKQGSIARILPHSVGKADQSAFLRTSVAPKTGDTLELQKFENYAVIPSSKRPSVDSVENSATGSEQLVEKMKPNALDKLVTDKRTELSKVERSSAKVEQLLEFAENEGRRSRQNGASHQDGTVTFVMEGGKAAATVETEGMLTTSSQPTGVPLSITRQHPTSSVGTGKREELQTRRTDHVAPSSSLTNNTKGQPHAVLQFASDSIVRVQNQVGHQSAIQARFVSNEVVSDTSPSASFASSFVTEESFRNIAHFRSAPEPAAAKSVVNQVMQQFTRVSGDNSVELRLHPEELGRVRLTMLPTETGMSIQISADRNETLDLLRRNIEMLANDLKREGFQDMSFSFGSDMADDTDRSEDGDAAPDKTIDAFERKPGSNLRVDVTYSSSTDQHSRLDIRV